MATFIGWGVGIGMFVAFMSMVGVPSGGETFMGVVIGFFAGATVHGWLTKQSQ
jgi:hypothetical protein